ncbi:MAG: outer membrane protein assembly factor BamD [Spirochaetaceae bacterium]|jgi:outer membrane protein assembly factor BamD (BamD/ComL family)|nr:outer membrane protein assembly factor BamD [Spirochaetaceae bacterium]
MYRINYTVLVLIGFWFVSCVSGPLDIPEDLSPAELIQRGQEALDRNKYTHALQYYEVLLQKYPENMELVCTAEYEIAFIHYKQKKYIQARSEFNRLLARYNTPDAELLPLQFKILSEIVLEKIPLNLSTPIYE